MDQMTAKERVIAAFSRMPIDRPAVISPTSVATVESMKAVGASFPDAHYDAKKMAALAAAGHDLLGFDNVAPYYSVQLESAAFGATMVWGQIDTMPAIRSHPFKEPGDFCMPADFLDRPVIKALLDCIRILRNRYGDEVAVCGKVMGPWTLSYNLYGVDNFLVDLIVEPESARAFLQAFKEVSISFALAQIEAGADMITWADHATGDMVSPQMYEEFLFPVHQQCASELKARMPRDVPVILHTCGRTIDRMPLFAQTGFDAFHFDSKNDLSEAREAVGDKMLLTGCVSNVEVLLNGCEVDVRRQVTEIVNAGITLVSPECAVPCLVKNDNLRAIVETVKRLGDVY